MDVLSYVLAADGTRIAVFIVGWGIGIVCWGMVALVMTK